MTPDDSCIPVKNQRKVRQEIKQKISDWVPPNRVYLVANDDCWFYLQYSDDYKAFYSKARAERYLKEMDDYRYNDVIELIIEE
jgi:hypothetical protein